MMSLACHESVLTSEFGVRSRRQQQQTLIIVSRATTLLAGLCREITARLHNREWPGCCDQKAQRERESSGGCVTDRSRLISATTTTNRSNWSRSITWLRLLQVVVQGALRKIRDFLLNVTWNSIRKHFFTVQPTPSYVIDRLGDSNEGVSISRDWTSVWWPVWAAKCLQNWEVVQGQGHRNVVRTRRSSTPKILASKYEILVSSRTIQICLKELKMDFFFICTSTWQMESRRCWWACFCVDLNTRKFYLLAQIGTHLLSWQ